MHSTRSAETPQDMPPIVMGLCTERRWSMIPLRGKRQPLFQWKQFQERRPSPLELLNWQETQSPSLWAVVTGALSGVVVLDFDGLATLAALGLEPHVTTPSGGAHVHVLHPGPDVRAITRAPLDERWPDMDVRGDGGYAVVCGHDGAGEYVWHDREPLPWEVLPDDLREALTQREAAPASRRMTAKRVAEGDRHGHLLSVGGAMAATGSSSEAIEAAVIAEDEAVCDPPQGADGRKQARDIAQRYAGAARRFKLSDLGNAERLVSLHGDDLRYVLGIGWHVWDGRRWWRDDDGAVVRMAGNAARTQYLALAQDGDSDKSERVKWARHSESEPRIRAAVKLAESRPEMVVRATDLDADPMLLGVENGTVNLRTGTLREHRREDLITKLAPVAYRANATFPQWSDFLATVTDGNAELRGFLQRMAGYILTGETIEKALFFVHGPGDTGKTTFVRSLEAMLGDYAAAANFSTFVRKRSDGGVPTDIARLAGSRLVSVSEVDDGARWAEGIVKQITGGDTVTARYLYRDFFEFVPKLKLLFVANVRPRADATDDALWLRMVQIPFLRVIAKDAQTDLREVLAHDADARSAILAWAVEGCLEWQRRGLEVPQRVREYTAGYRKENDPIARWLADECYFEPRIETAVSELRRSWHDWWEENGDGRSEPAWVAITRIFRSNDCVDWHRGSYRGWRGVGVRAGRVDGQDSQDSNVENLPIRPRMREVSEKAVQAVQAVQNDQIAATSPTFRAAG